MSLSQQCCNSHSGRPPAGLVPARRPVPLVVAAHRGQNQEPQPPPLRFLSNRSSGGVLPRASASPSPPAAGDRQAQLPAVIQSPGTAPAAHPPEQRSSAKEGRPWMGVRTPINTPSSIQKMGSMAQKRLRTTQLGKWVRETYTQPAQLVNGIFALRELLHHVFIIFKSWSFLCSFL